MVTVDGLVNNAGTSVAVNSTEIPNGLGLTIWHSIGSLSIFLLVRIVELSQVTVAGKRVVGSHSGSVMFVSVSLSVESSTYAFRRVVCDNVPNQFRSVVTTSNWM